MFQAKELGEKFDGDKSLYELVYRTRLHSLLSESAKSFIRGDRQIPRRNNQPPGPELHLSLERDHRTRRSWWLSQCVDSMLKDIR